MFKRILFRVLRNTIATVIAGWWATVQADPKWLAAIPVLTALGKWTREKWGEENPWVTLLPF